MLFAKVDKHLASLISSIKSAKSYHVICKYFSHDPVEVSHQYSIHLTSFFFVKYLTDLFVQLLCFVVVMIGIYTCNNTISTGFAHIITITLHLCQTFNNIIPQRYCNAFFSFNSA
jgi:hypothetical protein